MRGRELQFDDRAELVQAPPVGQDVLHVRGHVAGPWRGGVIEIGADIVQPHAGADQRRDITSNMPIPMPISATPSPSGRTQYAIAASSPVANARLLRRVSQARNSAAIDARNSSKTGNSIRSLLN